MPESTTPRPADRFRVGDVWRSPRGKDWQCDKVENGCALLRSLRNSNYTQWRDVIDIGFDASTAWRRISPSTPTEPPTNAQ